MEELGDDDRARLVERFGRTYAAGQTIFEEGEEAKTCFIVQEGRVRLVKRVRASERSLTILRSGEMFGEDALLDRSHRAATAVAITNVTVLALDPKTFARLLTGNPDVATRLVKQLVRRLRDAEEQLENSMLRDQPSRVINTLLRAASVAEPTADGVVVRLSPLELSGRAGIDVEAVKRVVQQLRDGGYVRILEEKIVLPDVANLRRLYQLLGMKEEVRGG